MPNINVAVMKLLTGAALIMSCVAILACATDAPPQPVGKTYGSAPPPVAHEPPSIDQQIFDADVIVVASLVSATASTQTISGDPGVASTYLPKQVLSFRASEYLKGTGPATFTVEVIDDGPIFVDGDFYEGYLTQDAAQVAATEILGQRNTSWDDRPGVLFLKGPLTAAGSSGASGASTSQAYGFTLSNYGAYSDFEYAVDTLSRTWLPASSAASGASGSSGASNDSEFITDGAKQPPPVVSLTSLKMRIGEIAAMLATGAGTEGYADCIRASLVRERYYRDWKGPGTHEWSLESGLAKGSTVRLSHKDWQEEYYNDETVSGTNADLFDIVVVDDDSEASNGFRTAEITTRPLPKGQYTYNAHFNPNYYQVCNFNPTHNNYYIAAVTVTAPAGTLHEAFFDPVTIGTAVGADATNGVLKPASFTVGETATEITSLKWENNQAVLTLSPHASLAHHALDFIELDGSVSLTLKTKDATVDATAGTHTWSVTTQPWHNGDKLMLRMRQEPMPPAFGSDTYDFTVAENASSFTIIGTALATDPNVGDEVLHTIESGNEGGKFQIDGFAGFILVWGTLDYETKSTYTLTIKADDGKGGTDTATINITVKDVAE